MKRVGGQGPTIEDVARAAGVSISTVSFVLNNRGGISEKTAERVRAAVEQLQYHPSQAGRSLASRQAKALGLLLPSATSVSDEFFSSFLGGVTDVVRDHKYKLILLPSGDTLEGTSELLKEAVRSKSVDGLILLEVEENDQRVQVLDDNGVPLVLFGRSDRFVPWVDVDNYKGAQEATEHLLHLGHRRIVHVAAPQRYLYARLRREGYANAMRQAGAEPWIIEGNLTAQSAYDLTKTLLTTGHRPTAIFAASDVMAKGVLQCAAGLGIEVPRQLSVAGFDDTHLAVDNHPPLTSVSQDPYRVGYRVGELLIKSIEENTVEHELVLPSLKIRSSTGPLEVQTPPMIPLVNPRLKNGAVFTVWSNKGTIQPGRLDQGVFLGDTRFLSLYEVRIDGEILLPLHTKHDSASLSMVYAVQKRQHTCKFTRELILSPDHFDDIWRWEHFGAPEQPLSLEVRYAPDFRDTFELRGTCESSPGHLDYSSGENFDSYSYVGQDGHGRKMRIDWAPEPIHASSIKKAWDIPVVARTGTIEIRVSWSNDALQVPPVTSRSVDLGSIETGNEKWNAVIHQALQDLQMLLTDYGNGPVFMAGIPWYGTLFGRDAIVSALQTLNIDPSIGVNTLATLTALQGRKKDIDREEMPGKIIHEIRFGELAHTRAIPYGRHYGSIDAIPLFIILFAATWRRTADQTVIDRFLPAVEMGLRYLESEHSKNNAIYFYETLHKDVESVHSWKNSLDSMVFRDGGTAEPPLALAEVQGYVYQAKMSLADVYEDIGNPSRAEMLRAEANHLKDQFHKLFWSEELKYYAMAVTKDNSPLDVLSSNPGQGLWSGIIPEDTQAYIVSHLISPELFSGWGIRTLASSETSYDPYSLHRGSVWPHDTGIAIAGLARAGAGEEAMKIAQALMDASYHFPYHRVPEFFSGEPMTLGAPIPCLQAGAPHAVAAGAILFMVQTLLGLDVNSTKRKLTVCPMIPETASFIGIRNIPIPEGVIHVKSNGFEVHVENLPEHWTVVVPSGVNLISA